MDETIIQQRNRRNILARWRQGDDPELLAADRDLRAAMLAEHARKVAAQAPPLTAEQRARIAAILRGAPNE